MEVEVIVSILSDEWLGRNCTATCKLQLNTTGRGPSAGRLSATGDAGDKMMA